MNEPVSYEKSKLERRSSPPSALIEDEAQSYCGCFSRPPKTTPSQQRKRMSKNMFKAYTALNEDNNESVYNATMVLINLYQSDERDRDNIYLMFQRCRLNPNLDPTVKQRNDLEYYIPQLINYLVFHEEMGNQQLIDFLTQASQVDFFFAHLVYFQLHSVSAIVLPKEVVQLDGVVQFMEQFSSMMQTTYIDTLLIAQKLLQERIQYTNSDIVDATVVPDQTIPVGYKTRGARRKQNSSGIKAYGTNYFDPSTIPAMSEDIQLHTYRSIQKNPFELAEDAIDNSFRSTIEFWEDLVVISERLLLAQPKIISLKADLQKVNERLPAAVYVPFLSNSIRNFVVLNIVFNESRVFSTKQRAPFYICLEIFRPEEEKPVNLFAKVPFEFSRVDTRLSDPRTLRNELSRISDLQHPSESLSSSANLQPKIRLTLDRIRRNSNSHQPLEVISENKNSDIDSKWASTAKGNEDEGIAVFYQKQEEPQQKSDTVFESFQQLPEDSDKFESLGSHKLGTNSNDHSPNNLTSNSQLQNVTPTPNKLLGSIAQDFDHLEAQEVTKLKSLSKEQRKALSQQLFGESEIEQKQRIRHDSPFRDLKSWELVHLIVKTGDNLKQEQFAMQLISQFNQIFSLENLPLTLTTYDVLSLGPSCGIIRMVKDATTMDSLKKTLHNRFIKSLRDFFHLFYDNDIREASSNFLYSLVGYSLVCYFLQLKDRHNGNILLHREGYLIHIDFGFLLSNAPGKGLEFEKKVPFKLLSEYIDILGGVESQLFERFRRLFFYLINQSIDNWRARWYDKYQYFFQGIFY